MKSPVNQMPSGERWYRECSFCRKLNKMSGNFFGDDSFDQINLQVKTNTKEEQIPQQGWILIPVWFYLWTQRCPVSSPSISSLCSSRFSLSLFELEAWWLWLKMQSISHFLFSSPPFPSPTTQFLHILYLSIIPPSLSVIVSLLYLYVPLPSIFLRSRILSTRERNHNVRWVLE